MDDENVGTFASTVWKVSKYGVFFVGNFLYSDWIQEGKDQKKLRIWTLSTQCSKQKLWLQRNFRITARWSKASHIFY